MEKATLAARWPAIASCSDALSWLKIQADLGLSPRTVEAYARALTDYQKLIEANRQKKRESLEIDKP